MMPASLFDEFETLEFPIKADTIYLIGIEFRDHFVPFYVGQTSRFIGRISDYMSAGYYAATDFRVGQAIHCFALSGHKVLFKYKPTNDPDAEEQKWITTIINDRRISPRILNWPDSHSYDPKRSDPEKEMKTIESFVNEFLWELMKLGPSLLN